MQSVFAAVTMTLTVDPVTLKLEKPRTEVAKKRDSECKLKKYANIFQGQTSRSKWHPNMLTSSVHSLHIPTTLHQFPTNTFSVLVCLCAAAFLLL